MSFEVGQLVRLHSLVSRPSLNGTTGRLLEFVYAAGRWSVQLGVSKKPLLLKPVNLEEEDGHDTCAACRGVLGAMSMACNRCNLVRYCDFECLRIHQAAHGAVCGSTNSACPACHCSVSKPVTVIGCEHRVCEPCLPPLLAQGSHFCPLCSHDADATCDSAFFYQCQGRDANFAIGLESVLKAEMFDAHSESGRPAEKRQRLYEEAVRRYQMVMSNHRAQELVHSQAACNLGNVLMVLKRYEEAGVALQTAVQADPNDLKACYTLGSVRLLAHNPVAAIAPLRKAVELMRKESDEYGHVLTSEDEERHRDYRQMLDIAQNGGLERPSLRFAVGDQVEARIRNEWLRGKINQLWYREEHWPAEKPTAIYQIWVPDHGECDLVYANHECQVRAPRSQSSLQVSVERTPAGHKMCNSCMQIKPKTAFSNKQWKAKGARRCSACVTSASAAATVEPADEVVEVVAAPLGAAAEGSAANSSDEHEGGTGSVAAPCEQQPSPLLQAAQNDDVASAKKLLSRDRLIDEFGGSFQVDDILADGTRMTALMIAAKRDCAPMVGLILQHGAGLDIKDASGDTALHHAVRNKSARTVELLVYRGVDVNVTNLNGRQPIDEVRDLNSGEQAKDELMELLQQDSICPICLCVWEMPTTISCGHTFCRGCWEGHTHRGVRQIEDGLLRCPMCKSVVPEAEPANQDRGERGPGRRRRRRREPG